MHQYTPSQILGGRPSKSYTHVMTHASWYVIRKMFCEYTPTSPEDIVANTLNFKLNFKFSQSKVFGGSPSPFGCALSRLGQSSAYKNLRGHHPQGPKCSLRRKMHLGGSMLANKNFCLWTNVHGTFFVERGRNRCQSHFFQIWISGVIPEIFMIKVESCQKSS